MWGRIFGISWFFERDNLWNAFLGAWDLSFGKFTFLLVVESFATFHFRYLVNLHEKIF